MSGEFTGSFGRDFFKSPNRDRITESLLRFPAIRYYRTRLGAWPWCLQQSIDRFPQNKEVTPIRYAKVRIRFVWDAGYVGFPSGSTREETINYADGTVSPVVSNGDNWPVEYFRGVGTRPVDLESTAEKFAYKIPSITDGTKFLTITITLEEPAADFFSELVADGAQESALLDQFGSDSTQEGLIYSLRHYTNGPLSFVASTVSRPAGVNNPPFQWVEGGSTIRECGYGNTINDSGGYEQTPPLTGAYKKAGIGSTSGQEFNPSSGTYYGEPYIRVVGSATRRAALPVLKFFYEEVKVKVKVASGNVFAFKGDSVAELSEMNFQNNPITPVHCALNEAVPGGILSVGTLDSFPTVFTNKVLTFSKYVYPPYGSGSQPFPTGIFPGMCFTP